MLMPKTYSTLLASLLLLGADESYSAQVNGLDSERTIPSRYLIAIKNEAMLQPNGSESAAIGMAAVSGLAHGAVSDSSHEPAFRGTAPVAPENLIKKIAALDTAYQSAVERNDWKAMDRILHSDFVLVLGDGRARDRNHLIKLAKDRTIVFERQVETPGTQTVRVFGETTATVTAELWLKGSRIDDGTVFDYKLWFTDTYVRTDDGWRYAFGQASLPLPASTTDSE